MKKGTFLLLILIFFTSIISACDICGCGIGNYNPLLFPHLSKNFLSIGYMHQNYRTHFMENGEMNYNKEFFNSYTLTGQYSPSGNLQLLAVLPFQVNHQSGTEGDKKLNKFGDLLLMVNYKLLDKMSKNNLVRQTVQIGMGLKLATGDYHFSETDDKSVPNAYFQAGTGSTDYVMNASYSLRYKKMAFHTGVSYKLNGTNKSDYRFGNKFSYISQVKYVHDGKKISIIPSAGILYTKMNEDKEAGVKIEDNHTGGYNLQSIIGIDINSKKWSAGISYLNSLSQHLANGHIKALPGVNAHISFSF